MLPRIHAKDFATVAHYLGVLLIITGAAMALPLAVALAFNELASAYHYLFGGALSSFVGALLRLFRPAQLDRRRSLILCGVSWVVVAFFGAIPLYLDGGFPSFLNAFFDSVSALTSTGVTMLSDVDHLPYAQITWRTVLTVGGAQAIIVIALYLGFFGNGGYSARDNARARRDSTSTSLRNTGQSMGAVLACILVFGTVVLYVLCRYKGFAPADALMNAFWLAGNAFSTGSFIPHQSSLIFYHSSVINGFATLLMLLGSLNFAFVSLAMFRKRWTFKQLLHNSELRAMAVWLLVLVVAVTVVLCRDGVYTTLRGLFDHATVMVVTAASTCGMQTVYPQQMGTSFPDGALIIIMAAMFVGGCSCSASGGLKMFRCLELLRWFEVSTRRSLLPDSVQVNRYYWHYGRKRANSSDAMLAMVITTLFIVAAVIGSATFIAHGYDAVDAMESAISYVTNTGMTIGEAPSAMTADLVVVSMLLMWLGRLEFVALISAVVILLGNVLRLTPERSGGSDNSSSTRKAQRKERRKKRFNAIKALLNTDITRAALPLLLVAALTVSAGGMAAPLQALAQKATVDEGAEVSASELGSVDTSERYRDMELSAVVKASDTQDGDYLRVSGEVIGLPVRLSDSYSWVNIRSDDGSMVGVAIRNEKLNVIDGYGAYRQHGTVVQIEGVLHLACTKHGDELDVHALTVERMQEAYTWTVKPNDDLASKGLLLLLGALLLTGLERVWRGKRRGRLFGYIKKKL